MLFIVKIVPLDAVKMMKDKLPAYHAALVNSTIFLVLVPVNYVSTRLTLAEKEETVVALNARLDGRPKKTAVPNAKPAKLEKQHTVISLAIPAKNVMLVNIVRAA